MAEDIFVRMDKVILKITSFLEKEYFLLNKKYKNEQRISDLRQGLVNKDGILIPLYMIDHKILFDGFEFTFFDSFYKLYKEIRKEKNNIFTEFAFRTLIELGFYRSQIVYSNNLTKEEKDHFKLLIWLSDYSSIAIGRPKNITHFNKLFAEFGDLLTKKEVATMEEMKDILMKQDTERHESKTEEIRKLLLPIQGNLYAKTKILPIFRGKKVKAIYSAWSHILHGNALLLYDMFSDKGKGTRHKLRVHWFLLLTGLNTTTYVANFLNDNDLSKELETLTKETKEIMDEVSLYWQQIEAKNNFLKNV